MNQVFTGEWASEVAIPPALSKPLKFESLLVVSKTVPLHIKYGSLAPKPFEMNGLLQSHLVISESIRKQAKLEYRVHTPCDGLLVLARMRFLPKKTLQLGYTKLMDTLVSVYTKYPALCSQRTTEVR